MGTKPWLYGLLGLVLFQLVSVQEALFGGHQDFAVTHDRAVKGFVHPESVAYDPVRRVLYAGQFGSVLKPTLKDGKGRISQVSLEGKVLAEKCLPTGNQVLEKPKGTWIQGDRLWVTDIDSVWVFDLVTRNGKKVSLPGAKFANDCTVVESVLLVSDTGGNRIYRVRPADWLTGAAAEVTVWVDGLNFSPNGLFPAGDGSVLAVGYDMGGTDQGIYSLDSRGKVSVLAEGLGQLDGLAQMKDGKLLITDWKSGGLMQWSKEGGYKLIVKGFSGPADFCVVPDGEGYLVVIPDLVRSEIRFIKLR